MVRRKYSKSWCLLYKIRINNKKYLFCTVNELIYCTFYVTVKMLDYGKRYEE